MRKIQGVRHLAQHFFLLFFRKGLSPQLKKAIQIHRLSLGIEDWVHDEKISPVCTGNIVDFDDIWMIERGYFCHLGFKSTRKSRVASHLFRQYFDGK